MRICTYIDIRPRLVSIFCIAVVTLPALAAPIEVPVDNHSFEFITPPQTVCGITGLTRGVDIWDASDCSLDGNGLTLGVGPGENGGQPTEAYDPADWSVTLNADGGSDACCGNDQVAYDARWPGWDNTTVAGPADGLQALLLDARGPGQDVRLTQDIGVLNSLPGSGVAEVLRMSFQARFGEAVSGGSATETTAVFFRAFFAIDGERDLINSFDSPMGGEMRLVETWGELGNGSVSSVQSAVPEPAIGDGLSSQNQHMGQYAVDLPLAGLTGNELITVGFEYSQASSFSGSARIYLDNVAVHAIPDSDGDGINDADDDCSNTPEGATVDAVGCADSQKDTDSDGVTDDLDQCANTPSSETADSSGCGPSQRDSDGDGVNDDQDAFPYDPTETVDSDGDGVGDNADAYPDDPTRSAVVSVPVMPALGLLLLAGLLGLLGIRRFKF